MVTNSRECPLPNVIILGTIASGPSMLEWRHEENAVSMPLSSRTLGRTARILNPDLVRIFNLDASDHSLNNHYLPKQDS